jgi:hypothetical protein
MNMLPDDRGPAFAPNYRDRAAAMRLILAMITDDLDSVFRVAHEAHTAADVDRFLLALADNFQEDNGHVQTMRLIGTI